MTLSRAVLWIGGVAAVTVLVAVAAGPVLSRVEQPDYKVDAHQGDIEVRSYGPMIAAETIVKGERKPAINEGFKLIAGYIFGNNKPKAKIAMTAPVEEQRQTIAMTAPVIEQNEGGENSWAVRFIMPKEWTLATLPVPSDPRVTLEPIPARRFVVVTFSGLAGDAAIQKRTGELRKYAAEHQLKTVGEPILAFYNPPWTLPMLRRNEIMLEIAPPAA